MSPILVWALFVAAAVLEVGGDALIRHGLHGRGGWMAMLLGALTLAGYGFMVNVVRWDFGKLLGAYVAAFAVTAVLTGRFFFHESIPLGTWLGLLLIVMGGFLIQTGSH